MRAIVSFAAAAMVTMSPLAAQGTSPVVLGPGEVLAQVAGTGQVLNRPEIARFRLIVTGRAENAAAARAACDAAVHDLLTKLRKMGVPDDAITMLPPGTSQIGFVGDEAYSEDDEPNPAAAAALLAMARQRKFATAGVQIELTDMSRLAAVRQLLLERQDVAAQPPILSLRNDAAARREAAAKAIAKAKE